jgi:hypothetical protein
MTMHTCQVIYAIDTNGNEIRCDAPADTRLISGCVHEHISTDEVCGYHAAAAQLSALICTWCHFGPDPHDCQILSREAAL